MDLDKLRDLLQAFRRGETDIDSALERLRTLPFADLGFARVDHHRALRLGAPEVVLGESKTPGQIAGIVRELAAASDNVLVTRVGASKAEDVIQLVKADLPELRYVGRARVLTSRAEDALDNRGWPEIPVLTAGTSDMPVAEEAIETLSALSLSARRVYDVGVSGIHRLLGEVESLAEAPAVIVVAGMEGALGSIVGGLVAPPVIAVPTSIGYGVSFSGLTALCGMLTGCAAGVTVVNVDNGFGAAMAVHRILFAAERARSSARRRDGDGTENDQP
jgi:pyridinium-3,5-biscarboxylic acid mononucleotide synthase